MLNALKQKNTARRIHIVCVALLLAVSMTVIFLFSAEPGDPSEQTSSGVVEQILHSVIPGFAEKTQQERDALIEKYQNLVRETAHYIEFVPLGFFAYFAVGILLKGKTERLALSAAFGVLYAVSDELHQYFVPGRSCQLIDVIIDSGGALTGVLLALLAEYAVIKTAAKHGKNSSTV